VCLLARVGVGEVVADLLEAVLLFGELLVFGPGDVRLRAFVHEQVLQFAKDVLALVLSTLLLLGFVLARLVLQLHLERLRVRVVSWLLQSRARGLF